MLQKFEFNDCTIRMEKRDDKHIWVCLTDMAKASGKLVGHWNQLKATQEFLTAFEGIIGITIMESNVGGSPETTGTWAIQEVALEFAGWCSVDFKIWMLRQIKTLMNEGTVSLDEKLEKSEIEKLKLEIQNLKLEKDLTVTNIALTQTQELIKQNQNLVKQSLEALSIQEEKNIENEYYLRNLAEITIEHSFIKKFFEISMLIKMSGYLFPEINYTIKDLLTIFSVDFPVRDIAFYSSHFYRLDNKGKNPHKKNGFTGSYVYSGKELIYPVVAIGILSDLSWEILRNYIEIDYKVRFPQSNRPFLPNN